MVAIGLAIREYVERALAPEAGLQDFCRNGGEQARQALARRLHLASIDTHQPPVKDGRQHANDDERGSNHAHSEPLATERASNVDRP